MRRSYRKTMSLLMLIIILVMGHGASGFNSKWLAHELNHDREMLTAFLDHDHAQQVDAQDNPGADPLSDTEHNLLHAFGHVDPVPSLTFNGLGEPTAQFLLLPPRLLTLLPAEPEPLFRPPRNTSLI